MFLANILCVEGTKMGLRLGVRQVTQCQLWFVCFCPALMFPFLSSSADAGVVTWTGAGGQSWSNASWNPGPPGGTDTVSFTDAGSVGFPGTVTSSLDVSRTIGGLAFSDSAGHYHTLDLSGFTLTVNGSLNFNTDQGSSTTTGIRDGILNVGGVSSSLYVGTAVSGGATGIADFSGLTTFGATLQNLFIGSSTAGGATGTLTLSPSNNISAQLIQVGAANNSGDANGTLHLGLSNTIMASEFDIGKDNGTGTVTIVNGGLLTLGSAGARTLLQVGNNSVSTNGTYVASLNLTGSTAHAYLSSLIVGQASNPAGVGGSSASFVAGAGTIDIGGSGNTANFYVGNNLSVGGIAIGTADFSALSTLNANVNNFSVGTSTSSGVSGNVKLAATNTISANNITIGAGGGGTASLTLGSGSNTIAANQFTIAQDGSNSTVTLPAGGSLALGSSSARTQLTVGNNTAGTNALYLATLNAAGGSMNAYISSMTVGQNSGTTGVGGSSANFTAGTGSIDIGASGNSANVYVGNNLSQGGTAIGIVDLSSMSSLNANLNNLSIGTSLGGGSIGTVKLAAGNTINATNIIVGSNGGSTDSLVLGQSNTILVNQLTIGKDYSVGAVTIPAGGILNLGSAAQPANLTIAVGTTNTNATYGGSLDLTNATFNARLDNVIIGNKDTQPGSEVGTLTISNNANNYISANSIALGGNQSTGTINYGGGVFYANSITKGAGTANFNWTGGTLSVGTFGSPAIPFALNNTGAGTLAPGSSAGAIGTTNIYGNYTQGTAATTAVRIAGDSPTTGNDQVSVSQTATLAGTLALRLTNSFVPSVGQNFLIATYGNRSGTYGYISPPTLPQNVAFQLDYTSNSSQLMVRMVNPTVQNYTSTASAGTFGTASNWDNGIAPSTFNTDNINNPGTAAQTITVGSSTTVHSINLSGTTSTLNLDVPEGIKLGVAYQLSVGSNAVLRGGGEVDGNVVVNGGMVSPGSAPGVLTVTGNYTAQPNSTLQIDLQGPGANGSELAVDDALALAGTLDINLNGYAPVAGDSFQLFSFGSVSGTFSAVDLPALSPGLAWNESQLTTTGELSVVAAPEPASAVLLSIASIGLLCRRRSAGMRPRT